MTEIWKTGPSQGQLQPCVFLVQQMWMRFSGKWLFFANAILMSDVSTELLCCDSLMGALAVMSSKASGLLWKLGSNRTFVIQLASLLCLSIWDLWVAFVASFWKYCMLIRELTFFEGEMTGVGYFEQRRFTYKYYFEEKQFIPVSSWYPTKWRSVL